MRSIHSGNTSAVEGACIAIFEWWLAKSQFLMLARLFLDRTPDEAFTSLSDENVGRACCKDRDPWAEFQRDIQADPCAKYIFDTYANPYELDKWVYEMIGLAVKNLPEWDVRLPGIKRTRIRLKTVKTVLES